MVKVSPVEQFPKTQRCFSWSSGSECRSHVSWNQWVTMTMDSLGTFFWVSNTFLGGGGQLHQPGQDSRNNSPPMVFLVLVPFKRFLIAAILVDMSVKRHFLRIASAWNMPFTNPPQKSDESGEIFPRIDSARAWEMMILMMMGTDRVSGRGPIFNLGYGYRFQHHHPKKSFSEGRYNAVCLREAGSMCWKADVHFFLFGEDAVPGWCLN